MLDIIEDREIYKTCNKFYREFGKLVDDFYKKTLMPDLHKISQENTQWWVEHALRNASLVYLETLSWKFLKTRLKTFSVLLLECQFWLIFGLSRWKFHLSWLTFLSDLMLNEVMIPAEEKSIDLSLFTYCNNQTENRMQGKPTNSKFGECWKNQFQGLNRIEMVRQVHIIKSWKLSNYFSYILQL